MTVRFEHRMFTLLLRWSGTLAMAAGIAILAWSGMTLYRSRVFQQEQTAALKQEMEHSAVAKWALPKPGALLGNVSIPRVGISSVILEGDDDHYLALSVGHIPGTAMPGQRGNVALAGHRDTFFRGLQHIRHGDDILLTTPHGNQLYQVDFTHVVSPKDVSVLKDTGQPLLTLVTCYPFSYIGPAPERFIVRAHLLGS